MTEIEITRGIGISSRTHHQFHHSLEQACFLAEFYGCGYVVKTSPLLAGTRFEAVRSIEALEWQQRGLWPGEQAEILLRVRIKDEGFDVNSFSQGVRLVVNHDRRRVDLMIDQRMFGLEVDDEPEHDPEHEEMEESDDENDEDEEDEWEDYSNGSDDADDEDSDDVEEEDDTDEDTVINAVSPSLSLRVGIPDEMLYRRLSSPHDSNMEDEDYSYSTDHDDDSDTTDEDDSEDSDGDEDDEVREPANRENEERWIQWVRERRETERAEAVLEMFRESKTDQEYRNYCLALNEEECRVFQTILDRSHWLKEFDAGDAPYAETAARRARWQRAVLADNKRDPEEPEAAATTQYLSQHQEQFLRQIQIRNGW